MTAPSLFRRAAQPILAEVESGDLLPLVDLTHSRWFEVWTRRKNPPRGLFRAMTITPHTADLGHTEPGWTLRFSFGRVEASMKASLTGELEIFALVWNKKNLFSAMARLEGLCYGYARVLTPAETIEYLAEVDCPSKPL